MGDCPASTADRLPYQPFRIVKPVLFQASCPATGGKGIPVCEKLMDDLQFPKDQVENGIAPEKAPYARQQQNIQGMLLPDMIQFMAEDKLPLFCTKVQVFIPKKQVPEGKGGPWLAGLEEPDTFLPRESIVPGQTQQVKERTQQQQYKNPRDQ